MEPSSFFTKSRLLKAVLLLWSSFFCFQAPAQEEGNSKMVASDEDIHKVFRTDELYRFPQFLPGKVFFRDGTTYDARLNYHRLYEQILFIDQKGDSLAIGNPAETRLITIGNDSFYYSRNNYLEHIESYPSFRLAVKQVLKEVDQQKNGAYGSR